MVNGRKRDKLIASLRNMQSELDCAGHSIPYWSTNRNDAWELWDELPRDKTYQERFNIHFIVIHLNRLEFIALSGISFSDVVSQAWLEWKQKWRKRCQVKYCEECKKWKEWK